MKRGRKRSGENGEERTKRERLNTIDQVLNCLKQRCAELEVNENESIELQNLVSETLKPLLDSKSEQQSEEAAGLLPGPVDELNAVTVTGGASDNSVRFSIVRSGREYIFKDSEDGLKFSSVPEALQHYQEHLAAAPPKDNISTLKKTYMDFFCNYCLSDSQVDICSFCGCRRCFGKFSQTESIVSCRYPCPLTSPSIRGITHCVI